MQMYSSGSGLKVVNWGKMIEDSPIFLIFQFVKSTFRQLEQVPEHFDGSFKSLDTSLISKKPTDSVHLSALREKLDIKDLFMGDICYISAPISYGKVTIAKSDKLLKKVQSKVEGWKDKLLSNGGTKCIGVYNRVAVENDFIQYFGHCA
ncbi:hypothetical protein GIB67_028240 [Kingdonia uniflora]|uniref:Uncharacterized protein n=1 Tax=Kingdonia uniflora TaxID=39325 RepID=A0A7J7KZ91_9MAGN|nr:hypothetical protein GIB67_028240 [Kingdonia uniflora]